MQIENLIATDKQCYMNTFGNRTPIAFTHGKGCTLYDQNGKSYTDFLAGIAVNCLGYGDEGLAETIAEQSKKLLHCSNIFYIEQQTLLAQKLFELSGGYKVFFANSGAEANEGAFKLARKYFYNKNQSKYEVISAKNSFHGRTLATAAATGQEKYQKPYCPLPQGFINVQYNDIEAVKNAITPNTAAVLVETVQGEGGVIKCDIEYLKKLRALCDQNGILLIIDEVQTGIYRTGKPFSFMHYGITPDIFTLAKGLGGGVPIGAVLAKPEIADAFNPGDHGTTFGGNPLACAAGNYVLDSLKNGNFEEKVQNAGVYLIESLKKLQARHSCIIDIRGLGLLVGVELSADINGKDITISALSEGYIINCAGHNTIRLAPPLIVTTHEIDGLITCLDKILP